MRCYMDEHEQSRVEAHSKSEHAVRLEKVEQLRAQGVEPWPNALPITARCQSVVQEFAEREGKEYAVAGRIMTIRLHGKTAFSTIQDDSGKLQIYVTKDNLGSEHFDFFSSLIDIGDIIWVHGNSFKTKTGEISLKITQLRLLSKSLYPLPEKFHGLVDVETRYRQRYLDLISNPESKDKFRKRSQIVTALRSLLDQEGFLEVETPMLHPIAGGAAARPFITHHNALSSDFYLRIAPELYLKRLVVGGFEQVYEINRNFRNEGVSTRHNPEFTMLEFYWAHRDYHFIMNFVEKLLRSVAAQVVKNESFPYGEHTIDFSNPFKKLTVIQAVAEYGGYSVENLQIETIDGVIREQNIVLPGAQNACWGVKLFALFEKLVEPYLVQPTFIIDYPLEISPLAKRDPQNADIASRFELFIGGMEIANGFNELNDPKEQAERFKEQVAAYAAGDDEAHKFDSDYILALEHALAPTVGVGIGIDRLAMLLTNTVSIRDMILFPTLKKK